MGALKDRVQGAANIGAGRVKQGFAQDIRSKKLHLKGKTQESKGNVQGILGNVKGALGNLFHKIGSTIKRSG